VRKTEISVRKYEQPIHHFVLHGFLLLLRWSAAAENSTNKYSTAVWAMLLLYASGLFSNNGVNFYSENT
jgi:hypothetical protein